jgi:hypothetical protein
VAAENAAMSPATYLDLKALDCESAFTRLLPACHLELDDQLRSNSPDIAQLRCTVRAKGKKNAEVVFLIISDRYAEFATLAA